MTRKMTKRITQCTWHGPVNHLYPGHALCIVIYGTCVASDKSALHWYGVHYFWPIGRHRNRRCGACRWSAIDSHEIISQAWRYGSLSSRRSTKFQGACFLCDWANDDAIIIIYVYHFTTWIYVIIKETCKAWVIYILTEMCSLKC